MFSFIKTMRGDAGRVMPDRSVLSMDMPFMRAYTQLVVKTCHKRGCFAMGGMSAAIPIKTDAAANEVRRRERPAEGHLTPLYLTLAASSSLCPVWLLCFHPPASASPLPAASSCL